MFINKKSIITYLIIAMIATSWFSYVFAAVPVIPVLNNEVSYIRTIETVKNILANTDYELSLEGFQLNLADAFASRQENFLQDLMNKISTRQENWLASFELAKIQKAREDVNKLTFETQRELTDQGVIIELEDPVTGQPYTIKKEGRIITNPDDFLFEEPIQKARDFVYCYLAPWKHFAWENEESWYEELMLFGKQRTSQRVCQQLPFDERQQCDSDKTRDEIKQRLLNGLVRKEHKWATAPPESWYTPAICEQILNSFSCVDTENCFLSKNKQISAGGTHFTKSTKLKDLSPEDKAQVKNTHSTLTSSVAYAKDSTVNELQQAAGNPNNNPGDLERHLLQKIQNIIGQYQTLRQAQYTAGQGIRPEKYLIAFIDEKEGLLTNNQCGSRHYDWTNEELNGRVGDCKGNDIDSFGRPLTMSYNNRGYTDQTFWFDTENVISPAIVLLQKMAASTQAQFDLARMGFKIYPDGVTDGLIQTGNIITDSQNSSVAQILANTGNLTAENLETVTNQIANATKDENKAIINAMVTQTITDVAGGKILTSTLQEETQNKLESTLYSNVDGVTATNLSNAIGPILQKYTNQNIDSGLLNTVSGEVNAEVNNQLDKYYSSINGQVKNVLNNNLGNINNTKLGQISNQLANGVLSKYSKNLGLGVNSLFGSKFNSLLSATSGNQIDSVLLNTLSGGITSYAGGFLNNLSGPATSVLQPVISNLLNNSKGSINSFVTSNLGSTLGGSLTNTAAGLFNNTLTNSLGVGGLVSNLGCSLLSSNMTLLANGCTTGCSGMPISNGAGQQIGCLSQSKANVAPMYEPPVTELPAPWEDASAYAELPPEYSNDWYGEYPPELGQGYYLNRWYKDTNQMYLPQITPTPLSKTGSITFDRILERWFCLEGPPGGTGNWDCTNERDPLNYLP